MLSVLEGVEECFYTCNAKHCISLFSVLEHCISLFSVLGLIIQVRRTQWFLTVLNVMILLLSSGPLWLPWTTLVVDWECARAMVLSMLWVSFGFFLGEVNFWSVNSWNLWIDLILNITSWCSKFAKWSFEKQLFPWALLYQIFVD